MFLYGLLGFGKIILVSIIVNEMGVNLRIMLGFVIERVGDLVVIFMNLNENDVLFIDEIYRINRSVEEVLYLVMEDFCLDIIIGKGLFVRSIRFDFFKFIFIGVIIRVGMFINLFRDRFGVICKLDYYIVDEFLKIVFRFLSILDVEI